MPQMNAQPASLPVPSPRPEPRLVPIQRTRLAMYGQTEVRHGGHNHLPGGGGRGPRQGAAPGSGGGMSRRGHRGGRGRVQDHSRAVQRVWARADLGYPDLRAGHRGHGDGSGDDWAAPSRGDHVLRLLRLLLGLPCQRDTQDAIHDRRAGHGTASGAHGQWRRPGLRGTAIPGLKIVAPSNPADVVGLMAAAIRCDDPVVFFEHKGLFATKGPAAPQGHVVPLGQAAIVRPGSDLTLVGLAATVPMALAAAEQLAGEGISAEVIDLRCLVPLDMATVLESVGRTSRLLIVEENPYQGGWGGTVASIVADEGFELLDAPIRRVAAACVPLPFADALEQQVIPTVDTVIGAIRTLAAY